MGSGPDYQVTTFGEVPGRFVYSTSLRDESKRTEILMAMVEAVFRNQRILESHQSIDWDKPPEWAKTVVGRHPNGGTVVAALQRQRVVKNGQLQSWQPVPDSTPTSDFDAIEYDVTLVY